LLTELIQRRQVRQRLQKFFLRTTSEEITEQEFWEQIREFEHYYKHWLLTDFFNYWSEKIAGKMRFQTMKTFEIKKRLNTWSIKQIGYGKSSGRRAKEVTPESVDKLYD